MSFILRPFRHSVSRLRADADTDEVNADSSADYSDATADRPAAIGPVNFGSRRVHGRLTADDLRAAAGRAAAAGSFDDGLPIRVSLD